MCGGHVPPATASFRARYPRLPEEYLDFLGHVEVCGDAAQNAWFLCETDYNADGRDDTSFRWNEWERIGLEAAEGDAEMIEDIRRLWNLHLPIMSAVHSDYAYLAISLDPANYGAIVYGYAPEFEATPTRVCGSFDEFLGVFRRYVLGEAAVQYQGAAGELLTRREFWDFM